MNSDLSLKQITTSLIRYRTLMITAVIIALLGYTGYQISHITAVQPDQGYVAAQQGKTKTASLKANKKTLEELKALQSSGDTSIPVNVGKHNPFTLN